MSSVGTFTLLKNEAHWIRAHLLSWLPHVDQMVFFDGCSTDGTLRIIKDAAKNHPRGRIITLVEDKDPVDLDMSYQCLFNQCLRSLWTDYAIFAHPDMYLSDPGDIGFLGDRIAYTTEIRSFAGDPGGPLFEIVEGRGTRWKNVYRLRNPDLGLHYFGAYGAQNEDCYFEKITGSEHVHHGQSVDQYPYDVGCSGIRIMHFSDVRSLDRRIGRMVQCLVNQGYPLRTAESVAKDHPRVTLRDGRGFSFKPATYPDILKINEGVYAKV